MTASLPATPSHPANSTTRAPGCSTRMLHPGVAMEYNDMTVQPGLVSVLDVGEQARLLSPDAPTGDTVRLRFTSSDPGVAAIDENGRIDAISPGSTTITITHEDQPLREMPLAVIEPHPDAPSLAPQHPRLRFEAGNIPSRREMIARLRKDPDHPFHADVVSFFREADALVDETVMLYERDISGDIRRHELPVPVAQPEPMPQPRSFTDYPFWTMLSRQIEQRMVTLSAAWVLTGDRRYADKARAQLLELARWSKWHEYDKATNNLSLPHFTMGAAIAYDELFDQLSDEERALVRDAILNLGMRPMTLWLESTFDHNINVLMNAGMLMGFLAIGDEEPHLSKYYHAPLGVLQWYLNERATSAITEGHTYTSYAVGTILPVASAIRNATGETDLYESAFIRDELLDFFVYFRGGTGGFANLSDSRSLESDPVALATHLFHEFEDPRAAWLLGHSQADKSRLVPFLQESTPTTPPPTLDLPRSRHFDRFDWVALRTGWSDDDALVAFVSSPSDAGHNHFDQNHFIVNIGGEWLITDPGYQNYTPGPEADVSLQTFGHNALLVNGEGQALRGNGRVIASDLGERYDYVVGDATAAYDGRLRRWHRHVVFAPEHRYLLLVDDVETNTPDDRVEILFHTLSSVMHGGEALPIGTELTGDGHFAFTGEEHGVRLAFNAPDGITVRNRQHPGAEIYGTWLAVEPSVSGSTTIVTRIDLDPSPETLDDFKVTRAGDQVSITIVHSEGTDRHRITLGPSPAWSLAAPD